MFELRKEKKYFVLGLKVIKYIINCFIYVVKGVKGNIERELLRNNLRVILFYVIGDYLKCGKNYYINGYIFILLMKIILVFV